jgi:hypothetical protein
MGNLSVGSGLGADTVQIGARASFHENVSDSDCRGRTAGRCGPGKHLTEIVAAIIIIEASVAATKKVLLEAVLCPFGCRCDEWKDV